MLSKTIKYLGSILVLSCVSMLSACSAFNSVSADQSNSSTLAPYPTSARGKTSLANDHQQNLHNFADLNQHNWYTVNDNVMGGISQGGPTTTEAGILQFYGKLSLKNNGGFSSMRSQIPQGSLSDYDGLELIVRGSKRRYTVLASPAQSRGNWQTTFSTGPKWTTIRVPFATMELSIRGWKPATYPTITGDAIATIGIMIADKNIEPFALEVRSIKGYTIP